MQFAYATPASATWRSYTHTWREHTAQQAPQPLIISTSVPPCPCRIAVPTWWFSFIIITTVYPYMYINIYTRAGSAVTHSTTHVGGTVTHPITLFGGTITHYITHVGGTVTHSITHVDGTVTHSITLVGGTVTQSLLLCRPGLGQTRCSTARDVQRRQAGGARTSACRDPQSGPWGARAHHPHGQAPKRQ